MKKNKKKYFLLFSLLIVFLFLSAGFAHALEITYPTIPGLIAPSATCTGSSCLSIYIAYFFGLLIYVAGVLALISFAVGAIGLINPNVEAHGEARDRMKGAVLGLVLTMASYIILQTINPTFIKPNLATLPPAPGVFLYNSSTKEYKECPQEWSDNSTLPTGFTNIKYICSGIDPAKEPKLLIWKFTNPGLEGGNPGNNGGYTAQMADEQGTLCGIGEAAGSYDVGGVGSFRIAFMTPGVYFCLGGCDAYMSGANIT